MKTINEVTVCYACRGCENSCRKNAIKFVKNSSSGIEFPVVDASLCSGCSACVLRCERDFAGNVPKSSFVLETKNEADLLSASSGGAFFEIARSFIREYSGTVYGAEYDDKLMVRHTGYSDEENIKRFRKSKYISSNTEGVFPQIKEELGNGGFVLFSGTPCQIAGLKKYLVKDYESLFTVDLICTGVMAPSIYQRFIELYKSEDCRQLDWRYKHECGGGKWNIMDSALVSSGGIKQDDEIIRIKRLYGKKIGYKDACYQCKYATLKRNSDITIGDYWAEKSFFLDAPNKGTSAILINTDKGKQLFDKTDRDRVRLEEIDTECIVKQNPALSRPTVCPEKNDAFQKDFDSRKYDIKTLLKRYTKDKLSSRIKMGVAKLIPSAVLEKIRSLKG